MLKAFKRELLLFAAITAFIALLSIMWGSPFIGKPSGNGVEQIQMQDANMSHFQGNVLRSGPRYLLRENSGKILRLDAPQKAHAFVGKFVTVTGTLGTRRKTIHVQRIQAIA